MIFLQTNQNFTAKFTKKHFYFFKTPANHPDNMKNDISISSAFTSKKSEVIEMVPKKRNTHVMNQNIHIYFSNNT